MPSVARILIVSQCNDRNSLSVDVTVVIGERAASRKTTGTRLYGEDLVLIHHTRPYLSCYINLGQLSKTTSIEQLICFIFIRNSFTNSSNT